MTESAVSTAPRPTSLFEDCLEIFYAPSRVFERRKGKGFIAPLLVLVVAMTVLFFATRDLMEPVIDAQMRLAFEQMQKSNPEITEEQFFGARGTMRTFAIIGTIVSTLVGPLLVGFLLWLVGKAVGAKQELGDAMTVGVFAWFPRLLGMIVAAVLAMVLPESAITSLFSVTLGLGRFFDPRTTAPALLAILGRVELFTLWSTVLLAIGLRVTGRVTTAQAALAAGVVWLLGAIPGLLGAMGG
jgi:hypothetical protein